ncbi:MAG: NPCBM/NEW2 domain-containing protein [Thermoguttaceae bacterium]|nr:NPCBM/NEW2 domain-containing protein [Thermoguttaceae bacterium]
MQVRSRVLSRSLALLLIFLLAGGTQRLSADGETPSQEVGTQQKTGSLSASEGTGNQNFAQRASDADEIQKTIPSGSLLLSEGIAPDVTFEGWDPQNERFIFLRNGRQFAFEPTRFLRWGNLAEFSVTEASLVLSDGSIFCGLPLSSRVLQPETEKGSAESENAAAPSSLKPQEVLEWENPFFGTLTFSLNELGGILFPGIPNTQREPFLPEILHTSRGRDILVFRTGERLEGEFLSISEDSVRFQTRALSPPSTETFLPASQTLEISQSRIAALLFSTELQIRAPFSGIGKYFWIGLSDGSILRMSPQDARFPLASVTRDSVSYLESPQESQKFFDSTLTSAAAEIPELRWLDEIPPSEVHSQKPSDGQMLLTQSAFWNTRASVHGQRLRPWGKVSRRGLGVQGNVSLIWKLDTHFSVFGAIPALEDPIPGVSVRFRVYADQKLAAECTLTSDSRPELMRVPIADASELRLETEVFPPEGSLLTPSVNACWLDAFLVPSEN